MRILGIDPGTEESAFVLWDGGEIILDSISRWNGFGIDKNIAIRSLIRENGVRHDTFVAVEHLQCFGMEIGQTTIETGYWIGEFRAHVNPERWIKIHRSDVKMNLCHSMRATDSNIMHALMDRFGVKGTKKNPGFFYGFKKHIWSAFAIAVTAYDKQNGQ